MRTHKPRKLTKAQQAVRAAADVAAEQRLLAFEAYRDFFKGRVFKAEVIWFDRMSGEGMVRGLNDEGRFELLACNIAGKRTWYPETACVYVTAGDVLDVELNVFVSGGILVSHTAGTLDQTKWDSLDQSRLAFKCNDKGEAITGLFAEGAGL